MTQQPSSQRPFVRLLEAADPRSNKLARAIELFGGIILIVTLIYNYRNLPVSLPVVINIALLVILFITLTSALQAIRDDDVAFAHERNDLTQERNQAREDASRQKADAERYLGQLQETHPELRKAAESEIEARLMSLVSLSANVEAYLTLLPEHVFAYLVDHTLFKIKLVRIMVVEKLSSGDTTKLVARQLSERRAAIHYTFEPLGSDTPNAHACDAVKMAINNGEKTCRYEESCGTTDPFLRVATGFRLADDFPWYVFTFYIPGNRTDQERELEYIRSHLQEQLETAVKLAYDRGNMIQLTKALAQKTSANTILEQRLNHAQKVKVDVKLLTWSDPVDNPDYNKDTPKELLDAFADSDFIDASPEVYTEIESDPAKLIELDSNTLSFVLPVWKSRLPEPEVAHVLLGIINIASTSDEPRTVNLGEVELKPALHFLQRLYDDVMQGTSGSLLNRKALESEWRKRARAQPGNGQHNLLLIDVSPQILRDSDARGEFVAQVERELRRCARTFLRGQTFEYDSGRYVIIGYDAEADDTADDVLREAERLSEDLSRIVRAVQAADESPTSIHVGIYRCGEGVLSQRPFQDSVARAKLVWQSALQDHKPAAIQVDDAPEATEPEEVAENKES